MMPRGAGAGDTDPTACRIHLTGAQEKRVWDDNPGWNLAAKYGDEHDLIQGDVGSGKTIVCDSCDA